MKMFVSLVAIGALATLAAAAETPAHAQLEAQIKATEAEIKVLHEQRDVTLKRVLGWYTAVIKHDVITAEILYAERKELAAQEDLLLAVAKTEEARKAIHARYDGIRALLRVDSKLDHAAIEKLEALRTEHKLEIHAAYDSKIEFLKAEVEALKAKLKSLPKK